jgi:glycine hydroxymethyltransferase
MEEMENVVKRIRHSVKEHSKWFEESLPLIASENLLSPYAKEMMISDFHSRYAEGLPGERYYEGNKWVDEVEIECLKLARQLFRCNFADVRPISGTVANMAVLKAMAEPGDRVGSCRLADGAHISSASFGAFGLRGVKPQYYTFDQKTMQIDVDETKKMLLKERPSLCLFGLSLFLFPIPLKELESTMQEIGARGWYDGAHVLGLIGGGQFQDPLHEGCVVMSASTHKTLPGPQHGILLGNTTDEELTHKLQSSAFPGVTSNHHLHTMAALAVSLAEHIQFGKEYAKATVENAQALGEGLQKRGFEVLCADMGFTRSHQIAVCVEKEGGGDAAAKTLESAGVVVNKNMLPGDKSPKNPGGLRLGSQELTRVGMGRSEMDQVAEIIHQVLHKEKTPKQAKTDVKDLKSGFTTLKYCFGAGEAAYRYTELVGNA